jgi:small subunit ribosomal protein S9
MEMINAIGRRKAAVARVYLKKGSGTISINGKELKEYFPQNHIQTKVSEPMNAIGLENGFDLNINVKGGGIKGQAEAIRLGISRALVKMDEEHKAVLKDHKFLTRDAREVERKKYGKPKARKSFQFSKR